MKYPIPSARLATPHANQESPSLLHPDLEPFDALLNEVAAAAGDGDKLKKLVATREYGDLLQLLWRASLRSRKHKDPEAQALLDSAARRLNLIRTDLTALLPDVPLAAVRTFLPPTLAGGIMGQEKVEKPAWVPDVKDVHLPLTSVYGKALDKLASAPAPSPGLTRRILHDTAEIVRAWSEAKTTQARQCLRQVRDAVEPSGLKLSDLRALDDDARGLLLRTTEAVYGITIDADAFVAALKDDPSQTPWLERAKAWSVDRAADVAKLLEAVDTVAELMGTPEAWEASRVLLVQTVGVTNHTPAAQSAVGVTASWYLPSKRDLAQGNDTTKLVMSAGGSGAALGVVGLSSSASGRGSSSGFAPGWLVATESDFLTEVGVSIPGGFAFSVGWDTTYGPFLYIRQGVSLAAALDLVPGLGTVAEALSEHLPGPYAAAGVQWYHPAFGPTRKLTESLSKPLSNALVATKSAWSRLWRKITGKHDIKAIVNDWPSDADWKRHATQYARAQAAVTHMQETRDALLAISPEDLTAHPRAQELLGDDAKSPWKTHSTITAYLDRTLEKLNRELTRLREMADAVLTHQPIDRNELTACVDALRRDSLAFEWIQQGLTSELLAPFRPASTPDPAPAA